MIRSRNHGLTIVEILVILLLIVLLLGFLIPVITRGGYVMSERCRTKLTINQLCQALKFYKEYFDGYPPDHYPYGGSEEGVIYKYRNDVLVRYLGGDTGNNPNPARPVRQFFEFKQSSLVDNSIVVDFYRQPFWYHNFQDDIPPLREKVVDAKNPLHPWTNAIFYKNFQIYCKADIGGKTLEDAYCGKAKTAENFRWITNYVD